MSSFTSIFNNDFKESFVRSVLSIAVGSYRRNLTRFAVECDFSDNEYDAFVTSISRRIMLGGKIGLKQKYKREMVELAEEAEEDEREEAERAEAERAEAERAEVERAEAKRTEVERAETKRAEVERADDQSKPEEIYRQSESVPQGSMKKGSALVCEATVNTKTRGVVSCTSAVSAKSKTGKYCGKHLRREDPICTAQTKSKKRCGKKAHPISGRSQKCALHFSMGNEEEELSQHSVADSESSCDAKRQCAAKTSKSKRQCKVMFRPTSDNKFLCNRHLNSVAIFIPPQEAIPESEDEDHKSDQEPDLEKGKDEQNSDEDRESDKELKRNDDQNSGRSEGQDEPSQTEHRKEGEENYEEEEAECSQSSDDKEEAGCSQSSDDKECSQSSDDKECSQSGGDKEEAACSQSSGDELLRVAEDQKKLILSDMTDITNMLLDDSIIL